MNKLLKMITVAILIGSSPINACGVIEYAELKDMNDNDLTALLCTYKEKMHQDTEYFLRQSRASTDRGLVPNPKYLDEAIEKGRACGNELDKIKRQMEKRGTTVDFKTICQK